MCPKYCFRKQRIEGTTSRIKFKYTGYFKFVNNGITGNIPALNTPFIKYLKLRNNMIEGVFSPVMKSWRDFSNGPRGEYSK